MSTITRILAAIAIAAFSVGPVSAATAQNASTLVAQASAGTISGTAVDETGAPIVGASVTVRGPQTYTGTTDAKGAFTISNIAPALYTIVIRKNGFDTASQPDFAVFAGEAAQLAITMHTSTLTTLQTIATVRTAGRGTINTSTAATSSVSSATFADQGAPQVMRTLNQVPGVQISLPQSSANGGSPGAITFPNIRGALSFETASLIDGHPLSVGTFGDYVTTFLSPYMFQGVDVIKGPGAMAPQTNYAIGGTVNFRTKDPTATVTPDYTFGIDNHGGSFFNLGVSDTLGRLGFVVDVSGTNLYGNINNYQANVNPNGTFTNGRILGFNDSASFVPGTSSQVFNRYGLTACCIAINGTFQGTNELLKVRYKFSDATTATVSYLGSQTLSDQNANTGSLTPGLFCPGNSSDAVKFTGNTPYTTTGTCTIGAYTGPNALGSSVQVANIFPVYNRENNNEPILQAEFRTLLGDDTIVGRFYHAGIQRLKKEGGSDPTVPTTVNMVLNGCDCPGGATAPMYFNNVSTPVKYFDYFNNPEIDSLNGLSAEYLHPWGNNELSFGVDQTRSTTVAYSNSPNVSAAGVVTSVGTSVSVPGGSSQTFSTIFGRLRGQLSNKLSGTLTLYSNNYKTTYLQGCYKDTAFTLVTGCVFDVNANPVASGTNNPNFVVSNTSHFDERLGLEYRPNSNTAVRFAAGSAIAPPYIFLFSNFSTQPSFRAGNTFVTANYNQTNPLPETAFGYDLGGDLRLKDGVTVLSADLYTTTLYNQLISGAIFNSGLTCGTFPGGCAGVAPPASTPVFYKENVNLNNARYSGLEVQIKHNPTTGWGYLGSAAFVRAYPYNIPPCFYSTTQTALGCANNNTLLGVVPNQNFTGGSPTQGFTSPLGTFNGVSNQNVPYLTANAGLSYNWKGGAYVAFGETFYGKNNSLNEPPFGIGYATLRLPFSHSLSLQISGDNIFNAYSNLFPTVGAGVPVGLAGTPTLTSPTGAFVPAPGNLPAQGGTTAGNLGPATWRFILQKNIGPEPVNSPNP